MLETLLLGFLIAGKFCVGDQCREIYTAQALSRHVCEQRVERAVDLFNQSHPTDFGYPEGTKLALTLECRAVWGMKL